MTDIITDIAPTVQMNWHEASVYFREWFFLFHNHLQQDPQSMPEGTEAYRKAINTGQ